MTSRAASVADLVPGFEPENDLERRLAADPRLVEGLAWGRPRKGHPEGAVANHVADLLDDDRRVGRRPASRRAELRFISLVHDAFKHAVSPLRPKAGENHHAMRARRFAEEYTDDERLLATIELHDRPYGLWRRRRRTAGVPDAQGGRDARSHPGPRAVPALRRARRLDRGQDPEPIEWLREEVRRRGLTPD